MRSAVFPRHRQSLMVALLLLVSLLALAPRAFAAGISLDRSPTPPQAIAPGQGPEQFNFAISFNTVAERYTFSITNQNGAQVYARTQAVPGQASPITGSDSWTPPAGTPPGRYTAAVQFYSSVGQEATASVIFDVSDQLGSLKLTKFDDLNGNGRFDQGEPLVPNWSFRLTNPQGNTSQATTGADGTVTLTNVPAGQWNVEELMASGWVGTGAISQIVTVPVNGQGTAVFGNVRPAPLSGLVWIDANGNQVRETTEVVRANTTLTLTGTTGLGQSVSATTLTDATGNYLFPNLMPGTYRVAVTVPNGLSATTPTARPNRVILSGVGNPNNDFGLNSTSGQAAGTPAPNIGIVKRGPAEVMRGATYTYRITVTNRSSFTARNVVITDAIPADLSLVAIPSGATVANGVVSWRIGNLAAGGSRTVTMRVRVNPTSTVTTVRNTAQVTATGLPPRRSTVPTRIKDKKPVIRRSGGVTG